MEIGNIFVVNKADREGSRKTIRELRTLIELGLRRRDETGWEPLIVETEALKGRGVEDLYQNIQKHKEYLLSDRGHLEEMLRKSARSQFVEALKDQALRTILERLEDRGMSLDVLVTKIMNKEADPYSLVQEVIAVELR
jgi:LAO/AO transport system kinase